MFLTLHQHGDPSHHDDCLVEVLDLRQLCDPFSAVVAGRIHGGEELQDPHHFAKEELRFPSGEHLPRCWRDALYRQDTRGGQVCVGTAPLHPSTATAALR
ncbi:MAG: hypothetical protein ACKO0M_00780 [Cyanobium sp.]